MCGFHGVIGCVWEFECYVQSMLELEYRGLGVRGVNPIVGK